MWRLTMKIKPNELIRSVIYKQFVPSREGVYEYKDLFNQGYIGYLNALRKKGDELTVKYAWSAIANEITRFLKKELPYHNKRSEEIEGFPTGDIADKPDLLKEIMSRDEFKRLLSPKERYILSMHFLNKVKLTVLAVELNVSRQRIHQIKTRAIHKLKEYIHL